MKRSVTAIPVAMAVLSLAACGGGEETEIAQAVERVATSGDPAVCTELQTQRFTEQVVGEGLTGENAVKACEANAEMGVASEASVSDNEIDGDSATANAAMTGSTFDGQTLKLTLVRENEAWKLDEFVGFEAFDREAIIAAFSTEVEEFAPPKAAECIKGSFGDLNDEQLQDYFVNPVPENVELVFAPCEKKFNA
jgi:hypothetical protein